mgnify:CR=1 FL=1
MDTNKFNSLKSLLSDEQRDIIKKYIFPHKHWSYQLKKELKKKKVQVI